MQGKIGQVNVTGLGLPSEMAGCVESGATTSFAIWNPIDLGYAATIHRPCHSLNGQRDRRTLARRNPDGPDR